jgi:hypothetical protein
MGEGTTDGGTEAGAEEARPLDEATAARIAELAGSVAAIDARLAEIDAEWDVERVLAASGVVTAGLGAAVALARHRRLLSLNLPANVALFLLQHALSEVRPSRALLRRAGFRDRAAIEGERAALLALRGPDAGPLPAPAPARHPLAALARAGRRAASTARFPRRLSR